MAVIYRKEGEKAVSLPSFSVAGAFTGTLYMLFHGYFKWAVVEVMADFALVIFAVILGTVMGHSWADIQFGFMLVGLIVNGFLAALAKQNAYEEKGWKAET
jgi:hypothetical protein